jgi:hypothetical protein
MNFLYGTYGFDILSMFLLILSMFFNFGQYTRYISYLLIIIAIYRAFSKNTYKRNAELLKFTSLINKLLGRFGKRLPYPLPKASLESYPMLFKQLKNNWEKKRQSKKQYKIVKCPKCKQKLRLPRGQHAIIVTCKKCSHEFKMKT